MIVFLGSYDYLQIKRKVNQRSMLLSTMCGKMTGSKIAVSGDSALLTFHTDSKSEERGFEIEFLFSHDGKQFTSNS